MIVLVNIYKLDRGVYFMHILIGIVGILVFLALAWVASSDKKMFAGITLV